MPHPSVDPKHTQRKNNALASHPETTSHRKKHEANARRDLPPALVNSPAVQSGRAAVSNPARTVHRDAKRAALPRSVQAKLVRDVREHERCKHGTGMHVDVLRAAGGEYGTAGRCGTLGLPVARRSGTPVGRQSLHVPLIDDRAASHRRGVSQWWFHCTVHGRPLLPCAARARSALADV